MGCQYCEMMTGKRKCAMLYEDDRVVAFMSPTPATIGHIVVVPRQHLPIFEAVPAAVVGHMAKVANKISVAVFEAIKCEGTNLIVHNGIDAGQEAPHFSMNIVARKNGDGLMFEWMPKQLNEQEMAAVELQIKEELAKAPAEVSGSVESEGEAEEAERGKQEEEKTEGETRQEGGERAAGTSGEEKTEGSGDAEENYLIKQLRRLP